MHRGAVEDPDMAEDRQIIRQWNLLRILGARRLGVAGQWRASWASARGRSSATWMT